ncbi:6-O-methylguanine DNA methyltransferase- DNA binding domain-containing protein [Apiospora saccharicola]|uniref:Methylated-DNA--protein-cysteine methyltransferase n=1 Tax=Apiospora saccharicola TaxID=335842 RepID=A0ABR1W1G8_9PEZI
MAISQKRKRTTAATDDETTADLVKPLNKVPRASLDATRDILAMRSVTNTVTKKGTTKEETETEDMAPQLARIAASDRTPFEKRVLSALCQIPAGCVSTYGLLSAHLQSSPRAVGGALRRNPFAPQVPCHRVVATGGNLGGFKGHWANTSKNGGVEGITIVEKKKLLRAEGVKIDEGKGRVLGTPWSGFV